VKVSSHFDLTASFNMKYLLAASSLTLASTALAQRTITVYNACPFTIWYVHVLPIVCIDDDEANAGPRYVSTRDGPAMVSSLILMN
jgi:hypothetical protein